MCSGDSQTEPAECADRWGTNKMQVPLFLLQACWSAQPGTLLVGKAPCSLIQGRRRWLRLCTFAVPCVGFHFLLCAQLTISGHTRPGIPGGMATYSRDGAREQVDTRKGSVNTAFLLRFF